MAIIGLMGGSYNPVHIGHMALANYMAEFGGFHQVWLCLSPLNPLKQPTVAMADDSHRLAMLQIAAAGSEIIKVCDIELSLPRPSYTINTLNTLSQLHPEHSFRLIIGGDNWENFSKWRASDEIIRRYGITVYPRPGYALPPADGNNVKILEAPQIELSSTFIREAIAQRRDMNYFMPHGVYQYIKHHHLYEL